MAKKKSLKKKLVGVRKGHQKSIPLEAHNLIYGERAKQYGSAESNFRKAGELFKILTGIDMPADYGMLFQVCLKLARESDCHKRDNLVDVAGYVGLIGDIRG